MSDERKKLLSWIDRTVEGWKKMAVSSHTKALSSPNLDKAIKEDIHHLKQVRQLIQQKPEVDDMEQYIIDKACDASRFYKSQCKTVEDSRKFITQIMSEVQGRGIEVDMNFLVKWQKKISKGSGGGHISLISMKKMLEAIGAKFK